MFNSYYVFVYGTLKDGLKNNILINDMNAEYIGKCETLYSNYDLLSIKDLYPGLIKGNYKIKGELYKLHINHIIHLDCIEGYPDFYKRDYVDVIMNNNEVYTSLSYMLSDKILNSLNLNQVNIVLNSPHIIINNNIKQWI